MLEFELDEEQKMLSEAICRFAKTKVRQIFREMRDEEGHIPEDIVQAGWDFGLIPTAIPEQYGGFGEYSTVTNAIATEEFAYGDLATGLNILVPGLAAIPIMLSGTEDQKKIFLPQFCESIPPPITAALSEPGVQFNPRNLSTTAVVDGDSIILNGKKNLVPLAIEAETFLIYANESDRTQAFIVPRDSGGLEVGDREKLMGILALPTYRLSLSDCRVPVENRLGGEGGIDFDLILNHGRVATGAAAVGVAKAGYEYARDYFKGASSVWRTCCSPPIDRFHACGDGHWSRRSKTTCVGNCLETRSG